MSKHSVKITLDGESDTISADSFVKIVKNTLSVLRDLHPDSSKWYIGEASHNSPLSIELFGKEPASAESIGLFLDGMSNLESQPDERPRGFNDLNLTRAKSIVSVLDDSVGSIVYSTPDREEPLRVTQRVAASADKVKGKSERTVLTDLEGRLGKITVHGGTSEFCIYERINSAPVTCVFDPKEAETIGGLITHRVRVFGEAKYSRFGRPLRVKVKGWKPLPDEPSGLSELHNEGITFGEKSSEDLVRELREEGWPKL
ncbi:MAG: hypothetical protein RJQ08_02225 [Salinisphaeraceae bacterium]